MTFAVSAQSVWSAEGPTTRYTVPGRVVGEYGEYGKVLTFELGQSAFRIGEDGELSWVTADGRQHRISLPMGEMQYVESVQAIAVDQDLLVVCGIAGTDCVAGFVLRADLLSARVTGFARRFSGEKRGPHFAHEFRYSLLIPTPEGAVTERDRERYLSPSSSPGGTVMTGKSGSKLNGLLPDSSFPESSEDDTATGHAAWAERNREVTRRSSG